MALYLETNQAIEEAAHDLLTSKGRIGVDLETTGKDPFLDRHLLAAFGQYVISTNTGLDIRPLWHDVMRSRDIIKIFHQLSFDATFFLRDGVYPRSCMCTMLGAMLLKIGTHPPKGTFSLGNLLNKCLGVQIDKRLQTSFVGQDPATYRPSREDIEYVASDVAHLPALAQYLGNQLKSRGLLETWRLENAYAPVLSLMHSKGVALNIDEYLPELEKAESEFDRLEGEVSTFLTPYILEVRRKRYERDREAMDRWQTAYASIKQKHHNIVYGPGVSSGTKEQLARYNALNKEWQADHKRPGSPRMSNYPILVTSHAQIKSALIEMGIEVEKTNKDTLYIARAGREANEQTVLRLLGDISEVKKIRTNEGREMLSRLRPIDGLSPDSWGLMTTRYGQLQATGRLSSAQFRDGSRCIACGVQNPIIVEDDEDEEEPEKQTCVGCGAVLRGKRWGSNMQNLTKRLRHHCHPRPGNRFIIADYSQIELRVGAELVLRTDPAATDAVVRAFRDGVDPHSDMAAAIAGWKYDEFVRLHNSFKAAEAAGRVLTTEEAWADTLRQAGKVTNFSATFFIGAPKLAVGIYIARKSTEAFGQAQIDEAQNLLDLYWERNPTMRRVLDQYGEQAVNDGYVATLGGRRRYFELLPKMPKWMLNSIKRRAANVPVQGTAADIIKYGQVLIYNDLYELEAPDLAWLWGAVHDETCVECAEEIAPHMKEIVQRRLTESFEYYIKHVDCKMSCDIQERWSH